MLKCMGMKYSMTTGGILLAIAIPVLGSLGFSEICANEVVMVGLSLPGLITAWIGRVRQGDVTILGFKKTV